MNANLVDVSILLSVFPGDSSAYFVAALSSISVEQVFQPRQVVVVVDGFPDWDVLGVIEAVSSGSSIEFSIVPLVCNRGLPYALNVGLTHCHHELVARFDSDDISLPHRIREQYEFMSSNESVSILGSFAYNMFDENDQDTSVRTMPVSPGEIRRLVWANPLIHPSVMYRKSRIMSIGGYRLNGVKRLEDYDLWIRCANSGFDFYNLSMPLIRYRVSGRNKNNFFVALNQFRLGFFACFRYGRSPLALIFLAYPILRSVFALFPFNPHVFLASLDPRGKPIRVTSV